MNEWTKGKPRRLRIRESMKVLIFMKKYGLNLEKPFEE
jgi:hypothetical protein